jgi:DNA-directed RNA polymerase subunit RPC12/RpoP
MDDELRLDGNAAAGTLGEVFSFEVTTAEYACGECGRTGRLGGAMVYEVRELGTIVRCPSCDNARIRLAHSRGRYLVDLGGMRYLAAGEVSDAEGGPCP